MRLKRRMERVRNKCASVLVSLAKVILRLTHRLFLMQILSLRGVGYGLRVSEVVRRTSWWLVRWKADHTLAHIIKKPPRPDPRVHG